MDVSSALPDLSQELVLIEFLQQHISHAIFGICPASWDKQPWQDVYKPQMDSRVRERYMKKIEIEIE